LLKRGASPNLVHDRGNRWPLACAVLGDGNADVVKLLLELGANPEIRFDDGRSLFGVAVRREKEALFAHQKQLSPIYDDDDALKGRMGLLRLRHPVK
jgi:ankyrin repeat protein